MKWFIQDPAQWHRSFKWWPNVRNARLYALTTMDRRRSQETGLWIYYPVPGISRSIPWATQDATQWHRAFTWFPVRSGDFMYALCTIERRKPLGTSAWIYRAPQVESAEHLPGRSWI